MTREKMIALLVKWSAFFNEEDPDVRDLAEKAYQHNKWFTTDNIFLSIKNIRENFLDEKKLQTWLNDYPVPKDFEPRTIGIIMAGNIPLVGFHDLLCTMAAGHRALIKISSKDTVLLPWFLNKLYEMDESYKQQYVVSDMLKGMDAAIATGSNNSSRYFEYYFSRYPHIIRKNRGSVAVLTGNESSSELERLGFDIFSYFGLGCRNVSKLFVPEGYVFNHFFESLEPYRYVMDHNKYKNNYDYNRTLLLLNKTPHLANDFLALCEDERMVSPVSMLYYEYYKDEKQLREKLDNAEENIQCTVGNGFIPFGKTQTPGLEDYSDNVDTVKFLLTL